MYILGYERTGGDICSECLSNKPALAERKRSSPSPRFHSHDRSYNSSVHLYLRSVISLFHLQELLCQCHQDVEQKSQHFTPVAGRMVLWEYHQLLPHPASPWTHRQAQPVPCSTRPAIHPQQPYWMALFPEKVSFQITLHHGSRGTPLVNAAAGSSRSARRGQPQHGAKLASSPWHRAQQSLGPATGQMSCNYVEGREESEPELEHF